MLQNVLINAYSTRRACANIITQYHHTHPLKDRNYTQKRKPYKNKPNQLRDNYNKSITV